MKKLFIFTLLVSCFVSPVNTIAQELYSEVKDIWRGEVISVLSEEEGSVLGTPVRVLNQNVVIRLDSGPRSGEEISIFNDYIRLKKGDNVFVEYIVDIDGVERFQVSELDRRGALIFFALLFISVVVWFGRGKGIRALVALGLSFVVIFLILLPKLLSGHSPVLWSILVAVLIMAFAMLITHGWRRKTVAALIGTSVSIVVTTILAQLSVWILRLSGIAAEESVYLNFSTGGTLDFRGILLGAIIIGVLGILDDISITQASAVEELFGEGADPSEVYSRAIHIGRDHVGALVNTLALAYTGAALPLLLLFSVSSLSPWLLINREIFTIEIVRTVVGGIGLVLAVPVTTYVAVWMCKRNIMSKSIDSKEHRGHHHIK